jgi:hypothetical protein
MSQEEINDEKDLGWKGSGHDQLCNLSRQNPSLVFRKELCC